MRESFEFRMFWIKKNKFKGIHIKDLRVTTIHTTKVYVMLCNQ